MSDTVKFKCFVSTTNPDATLAMEVKLNGTVVVVIPHIKQKTEISFDIPDHEAKHKLELVMSGKTHEHTKIDQDGTIVSDSLLIIDELTIDDISLQAWLPDIMAYSHDFNGTQQPVVQKFFGNMGCNGTLIFEFSTPFYLWLLEQL